MGNKKCPRVTIDRNGRFIISGEYWKSFPGEDFKKMMEENDYVKVVRCKNCKYLEEEECPWTGVIDWNGYCSKGERREDAETN